MKMPDNTIVSVKQYFKKELSALYPENEISRFFELAAEHYFNLSSLDLITNTQKRFSESEMLSIIYLVKALKKEEPIQYALGEAHFYDLKLKVNGSVLIPRPETEELVQWIHRTIQESKPQSEAIDILDIGTGSGAIALALKSVCKQAQVCGVDVSVEALNTAKENGNRLGLAVDFLQDDILNTQLESNRKFDIIVSNPPYVKPSEKEKMSKNVVDYEPHTALFVPEEDALIFHRTIADFAKRQLNDQGYLFFEINEALGEETKEMLANKGFKAIEIRRDLSNKNRMIKCQR